ncbi:SPOR domain-containing protein [Vibrio sp. JC009]|uniref:SPOR domain-containing protein n=1 Tax=Vibrio sp. JC009 TaxID=2912314 RepID=UPI0023B1DC92|nr:SPOR domain-containing protein [Vibrio sp. JC009]WED20966.1 SPOR domain-containing protein [Vibrio sp. JC009]
MASKFQSRLVGTIILAAVGIIVLPDVLDGEKLHYKEDFATIPVKPEIATSAETFEVLEPVEEVIELPESPVVVTETIDDKGEEKILVAEKPVQEKNEYQSQAWIIQLMALKNAANAETLVKDLQKRGYRAHTKKENGFTRVIVGPDVSKAKLEKQIIELEKITGSKGQLHKFNALNL